MSHSGLKTRPSSIKASVYLVNALFYYRQTCSYGLRCIRVAERNLLAQVSDLLSGLRCKISITPSSCIYSATLQASRVNFYELRRVVASLIDSIRCVRERKNPFRRRLVNNALGGRVKSDTSRILMYLNARHQYIHIYMLYDRSTSQANVLVRRLAIICELWKKTSNSRKNLHVLS